MKGFLCILLITPFLFAGCDGSLRGGGVASLRDEQLSLKSVGFTNSRNSSLGADVILSPATGETDLKFTFPFNIDIEQTFVLTYELVSSDGFVQYKDADGQWQNGTPSGTNISFVSSALEITTQEIRVVRYDANQRKNFYKNYTLRVNRFFKLSIESELAADAETDKAFIFLNPVFKDNAGRDIGINTGTWNKALISSENVSIEDPYFDAAVGKYRIKVSPLFPGSQTIEFKSGAFRSAYGDTSNAVSFTFQYRTPTIYLSQSGSSSNSGTSASQPLNSWTDVMTRIKTYKKDDIVSVLVAASNTPYNVDSNSSEINGSMPSLRIVGGYNSDFSNHSDSPWKSSSSTIFETNSVSNGTSELNPAYVFKLTGDIEKDSVFITNLRINAPNVQNNAAVLVDAKAQPRFVNLMLNASKGTRFTTALLAKNGSHVFAENSRFFGKTEGTGDSSGIRLDYSSLTISKKSVVSGGDLAGVTVYGIRAEGSDSLNIEDSIVLAGRGFSKEDANKEANNYGVYIGRRNISGTGTLKKAWIHAVESNGNATGILVDGNGYFDQLIDSGTIIVEGDTALAIDINETKPNEEFYLNNSVLLRKKSTATNPLVDFTKQTSAPILSSTHPRYLLGNFMAGGGIKYGGDLRGSLYNNLIQSGTSGTFVAVQAPANVSPIQYNNVWKSGSGSTKSVRIQFGTQSPAIFLDSQDSVYINGNIEDGDGLTVDANFVYDTDMDVGKIEGNVPNDVAYGGYNLSLLKVIRRGGSALTIPNFNLDRDGNTRTGNGFLGYSMGPYERGTENTFIVIYVSPSGSDFNPLGTIRNPFASIDRAFRDARSGTNPRKSVSEIRIMRGKYQQSKPLVFDSDIRILGGYDAAFSTRETTRSTELEWVDSVNAITIKGTGVSRSFLMDGFTIKSEYRQLKSNANYTGILVSDSASPTIKNNSISFVGQSTQTNPVLNTKLRVVDIANASPLLDEIVIARHAAKENLGNGSNHQTETRGIGISGDSSKVVVSNSQIEAGDGLKVFGITASGRGTLKVTDTTIVGNSNTTYWPQEAVGMDITNRQAVMEKVVVTGGYAREFYGIKVGSASTVLSGGQFEFKSGIVHGGFNDKQAFQKGAAIRLSSIGSTSRFAASGSLIYAGRSSVQNKQLRAVEILNLSGKAQFIGNTIYGGRAVSTSSSQNSAFRVQSGRPSIVNNIILVGAEASTGSFAARGYDNVSGGAPIRLRNNLFLGVNGKMTSYRAGSVNYDDAPGIKTVLSGSDSATQEYDGNRVRYESSINDLKNYFNLGISKLEDLKVDDLKNALLKPTGSGMDSGTAAFIKEGGHDYPDSFSLNVAGGRRAKQPSVGAY